jgi:hypothetical protein
MFPSFRANKDSAEASHLNFSYCIAKTYNTSFSMDMFMAALEPSVNTSPGPNLIYKLMLYHLPPVGRQFLLSLCNCIWAKSSVPVAWREAVFILILKPGTVRFLSNTYMSISLTSYLRNTMECMVNCHLV